jgi:hypothetical protein
MRYVGRAYVGSGSVASHPDVRGAPGMSAMPPMLLQKSVVSHGWGHSLSFDRWLAFPSGETDKPPHIHTHAAYVTGVGGAR